MLSPADRRSHGVPALVARVRDALGQVVREGVKFGAVGAVAYVVNVGLYQLLVHTDGVAVLADRPITGKIVAAAVSIVVAWLGNRYWTFRLRRRQQIRREVVLFFAINGVGIGIEAGCLAVSRYVLGYSSPLADYIAGNVVGLVIGTVIRYLAYRFIVFRGDLEAGTEAATAAAALPAVPAIPASDTAPSVTPATPVPGRQEPQRTWTTSPALSDTGS